MRILSVALIGRRLLRTHTPDSLILRRELTTTGPPLLDTYRTTQLRARRNRPIHQTTNPGRHNQPLYVKSYFNPPLSPEKDLKWHFVAHTSLDIFEERGERSCGRRGRAEWEGLQQGNEWRGSSCSPSGKERWTQHASLARTIDC